jgi:hypothetical protein
MSRPYPVHRTTIALLSLVLACAAPAGSGRAPGRTVDHRLTLAIDCARSAGDGVGAPLCAELAADATLDATGFAHRYRVVLAHELGFRTLES